MQIPPLLLESLRDAKGFDENAFVAVHENPAPLTSIRINPSKPPLSIAAHAVRIPWTEYGYYLEERPSFTFDPLFHAGTYYVQEASSMFIEQVIKQHADPGKPLRILDLCASPGGKSTHLQSLISDESLLVSNEVIRSRASVLKENIIKWGTANVVVTNNDPSHFTKLENFFDIILVDAPCSGSGLFRRDPLAINEWSENNVALCCQRQQRIIADIWPALKKSGMLIYCTCSYSIAEDEAILDWIVEQYHPVPLKVSIEDSWGIIPVHTKGGANGYRCWPDKIKGEGFFLGCFQKTDGDEGFVLKGKIKPSTPNKNERDLVMQWMDVEGKELIRHEKRVYAWPSDRTEEYSYLLSQLKLIYSGIFAGELMRDKMIPSHALALYSKKSLSLPSTELSYEEAIKYLQRKDLSVKPAEKGWQLVTFQGHPLGWINALSNRINNYYPKESRILKDN